MRRFRYITGVLALALITLQSIDTFGQQRPVLSQYMFSGLVLNPAYAGRHEYTSATMMYRDQWVNLPGSPRTMTVTGQSGFKDRNMGVGMIISNDDIGVHQDISVYGSFAYLIEFPNKAKFSMGVQGGFDSYGSNWTLLILPEDQAPDPLMSGEEKSFFPNFGAGLFYYSENFYVGASAPYLLKTRSQLDAFDDPHDVRYSRNYYLTGGIVLDLGPKLKYKPSVLIRMEDNQPVAFDINSNLYYDEVIDIGVSYRQQESFIVIMGLQLNKYMKFSYAYDFIYSALNNQNKGTHELMLQYRINFNAPKHHRMCPQPQYF